MHTGKRFVDILKGTGASFFSGVPCSVFRSVIPVLEQDPEVDYVPAVQEGIAVSLGFGCALAGRTAVALMQNTGLGNALEALVSLPVLYEVPLFLVISYRGYEQKDERQHWEWARVQNKVLDGVGIPYWIPKTDNALVNAVEQVSETMHSTQRPAALVLIRGMIDETI